MIRAERLAAIAVTSFGLIVGRAVRKEPLDLLNQIKDSGEIAIPFTIALGAESGGVCTAVNVSSFTAPSGLPGLGIFPVDTPSVHKPRGPMLSLTSGMLPRNLWDYLA